MKYLFSLVIISSISFTAFSINLYSIADGNWNNGSVWSLTQAGASCNCTPSSSDYVTINHQINLNIHLINQGSSQNGITGVLTINAGASLSGNYDVDIRSSGTLILCGILNVRNVIFSNGSTVNVCPTGDLVINGSFENKNSSNNVSIDGNMTVHGSFTNGNGGIISGNGNITIVNGPTTNTGSTFGCAGMDPCTSYPCNVAPCSVLPIQLISFYAKAQDKQVDLEWLTASEKNNDFFTIEKSFDGYEFYTLATIKGAGNSNQLLQYTATDFSPIGGTSYYRLKQTDFDGKFTYSSIVAVKIHQRTNLKLLPNPSNGNDVVVVLSSFRTPDATIIVSDITGSLISEHSIKFEKNVKNHSFKIDPHKNLTPGIYFVSLKANGEINTEKIVISN